MTLPVTTHSVPDWIRRAAREINRLSQGGSVFPVWAEENSGLSADTLEWAFGNGANMPQDQGIVLPQCELFATAASLRAGTATIGVYINDSKVAEISDSDAVGGNVKRCYRTLGSPIQVPAGSVVGFRTVAASGTTTANTVTAWFRST